MNDAQRIAAARDAVKTRKPDGWDELSPRQCEVMLLLLAGLNQAEIGRALNIKGQTARVHARMSFVKLGFKGKGRPKFIATVYGQALLGALNEAEEAFQALP